MPGWGTYVLFTREAKPTDAAAVAFAASSMDALNTLADHVQVAASADGTVFFRAATNAGDWLAAGLDQHGNHVLAIRSRGPRPGTHADVWGRVTDVARRIAQKRWNQLDELRQAPFAAA